jgi:phosphoribosylformylglycinamidine synthase
MMFASRCGLTIDLSQLPGDTLGKLFNEELGAIAQVKTTDLQSTLKQLQTTLGKSCVAVVGKPTKLQQISISDGGQVVYRNDRIQCEQWWADTSYQIQRLRDNPAMADQEFETIKNNSDPGLSPKVTFKLSEHSYKPRPKVAILREQGVNGQTEMAAAFDRAGFKCVDVHLNDLMTSSLSLDDFVGLVACGGFSYGDVLGAGEGWAKTILFDNALRQQFAEFFSRPDSFSLGVCNGCQMLAGLKEIIPGAEIWPKFLKNQSEQFEARVVLTQINDSPSVFFKDMVGSYLPIPVAHGEGRASFVSEAEASKAIKLKLIPMQYVSNDHKVTKLYPTNPNGSVEGIAAMTTPDGRATIMMPHPERAFMTQQLSWHPETWETNSPWLQLFQNARIWVN